MQPQLERALPHREILQASRRHLGWATHRIWAGSGATWPEECSDA